MLKSRPFEKQTAKFLRSCGIYGKSALDIGARYKPKYGAGLFEGLKEFGVVDYTILEIHEPNVKEMREHGYPVVLGDVRQVQRYFPDNSFDIVSWIHGPEHLNNFAEIYKTIKKLKKISRRWVIVSFPIGRAPQGEIYGNPHEHHRYTIPSVRKILGCFNKKDRVNFLRYRRLPRIVGEYTVKFNPNAVIVYRRKVR